MIHPPQTSTKPFSRGEGGPPERSEELAGRKRNSGGNLKICTTKQTSTKAKTRVEVFKFQVIERYRPHSSPDPFGATISPGEGFFPPLVRRGFHEMQAVYLVFRVL